MLSFQAPTVQLTRAPFLNTSPIQESKLDNQNPSQPLCLIPTHLCSNSVLPFITFPISLCDVPPEPGLRTLDISSRINLLHDQILEPLVLDFEITDTIFEI